MIPDRWLQYIYVLEAGGQVRYVGRTGDPKGRFAAHKSAKTPLGAWVRASGATIRMLEALPAFTFGTGRPYAGDRERHWIERYRADGADLFNVWPIERAA